MCDFHNATCFERLGTPFYYSPKPTIIDGVSDVYLCMAAPVLAYWSLSMTFHYMDMSTSKWIAQYRIHPSEMVEVKNRVTRSQVVWAVIFQQVLQTVLGLMWVGEHESRNFFVEMQELAQLLEPVVFRLLGRTALAPHALANITYVVYWWLFPVVQLLAAMFFIDTWQYFLHRFMHINKFLYRHFHSWHHRLYVPYAFGSLYNHPVEGFVLDSLGTALAEAAVGLSTRQAMVLFTLTTFKTVDDHCGYRLPFDPLQLVSRNNADYHDIHHQAIGIKYNFAQPWWIHWDVWLGTRLTREDLARRREKYASKSE